MEENWKGEKKGPGENFLILVIYVEQTKKLVLPKEIKFWFSFWQVPIYRNLCVYMFLRFAFLFSFSFAFSL